MATLADNDRVPLASVITVNTNEKHRLELYLPSVHASRGDFEVIIADNGSSDGSLEFIAAHFPQTRVLANGANLGFTGANNRASTQARADILVFLNPDTTVDPDWLVHLLQPFADPTVGLVTSKILLLPQPAILNTCGNDVHISGLTLCRGMGQPRQNFPEPVEVGAVSGAAFAIRRGIFEKIGGFDEDFFMYVEETDLSLQSWLAGWRCLYEPRSLVYHDYKLRFGPKKVLYQERNRYLMFCKNFRWPTLLALAPALWLAEVVTWGFVLWGDRPNWRNKFRAYGWMLSHARLIRQKHRRTQALRKISDRQLLRRLTWQLDFGQVSRGAIGQLAALIFNPLFFLLRGLALVVVWW